MRLPYSLSVLMACLPAFSLAAQEAGVGDAVAEFDFGPMLNGDGRSKLSEFRGQPILIDFWGTH